MKLEMHGQMRMEQRMKLAPHMIQSMEILQLPILELQARIEQELNSNPVLDIDESSDIEQTETPIQTEPNSEPDSDEDDSEKIEDFARIENLDDSYREHISDSVFSRRHSHDDGVDYKLEAIKNTAAPLQSLHEYLVEQWRLVETDDKVKKAGSIIIDYIDNKGYLTVRLEQLHNKDSADFSFDDLKNALEHVQKLEPVGVGARDLKECLLIQLAQDREDCSFEKHLVSEHMNTLLENRLPDIARKMNCTVQRINEAIVYLSRLDTSPGLQINQSKNHPIKADVIVEHLDNGGGYSVRLADTNIQNLKINEHYMEMSRNANVNEATKTFLQNNIRSAQWIIDAIEQRKSTLLRVAKAVVKHQQDFFDKGQLHLRPLPMSKIADEVGVHLATVSRAVAGKYAQCSWGILPLRKFFSGGTEDANGQGHSWEAVRAKLQQIIDTEDKSKPLSDDKICKKLAEKGTANIARRTVAKYRKLLNIPAARYRKKF